MSRVLKVSTRVLEVLKVSRVLIVSVARNIFTKWIALILTWHPTDSYTASMLNLQDFSQRITSILDLFLQAPKLIKEGLMFKRRVYQRKLRSMLQNWGILIKATVYSQNLYRIIE